jgi:hypothetical protein
MMMVDERRICRTEAMVGLSWVTRMPTGVSVRMATVQMRMRRNKCHKLNMDQCRMWRTEGIVLECVNIELYKSDQ